MKGLIKIPCESGGRVVTVSWNDKKYDSEMHLLEI